MKFTLVCDGPSDQCLLPILEWTLRQAGVLDDLEGQWADLGRLRNQPAGLSERIRIAVELFDCDLLFVHRDAEKETWAARYREIQTAIDDVEAHGVRFPYIFVIPVRMQESWLLFDEKAIRAASANPNGTSKLALPQLKDVENLPDPKALLSDLIRDASELGARRLRKLPVSHARRLVAEYIDDFAPLRALPAFAEFERALQLVVRAQHWN